jgi:hypothetical protein
LSRKYKLILISLLCCGLFLTGYAQDAPAPAEATETSTEQTAAPADNYETAPIEQHNVDKGQWKKAKEGIEYVDTKKEEPKKEEKKKEDESGSSFSLPSLSLGVPAQIALFAIIIVVLLGVVYLLIASRLKNRNIGARDYTSLEDIEENLHESDLDKAIREALEKKNYKLAIRLYYLAIIKELSLRKWIQWKKEKTNLEYLREMGPRTLYPSFREVTLTFEKAWYGDFEVMEAEYHQLSPQFKNFLDSINRSNEVI